MILQLLPANEGEGMILWIIIVTVLATMGIAILRSFVGSIVGFFILRKGEAQDEVRRFSMVSFVYVIGIILLIFQESIALFLKRPTDEIAFAGLIVIIGAIFITGFVYRKGAERVVDKIRDR